MDLIDVTTNQFLQTCPKEVLFAKAYTYGATSIEYYQTTSEHCLQIRSKQCQISPQEIEHILQKLTFLTIRSSCRYLYLQHYCALRW